MRHSLTVILGLAVLAFALIGSGVSLQVSPQHPPVCSCSRQADSLYLIQTFFPATNGPAWAVDVPGGEIPWNTGAPLDQWVGVVLNAQGCVQELNLEMRDLSGAIPSDIGQLCALKKLILSNNALGGGIPASIGDLELLEQLWLINTGLGGPIPPEIGNLKMLFDLRLSDNQLSGNIPDELGNCDGLFRLWLDDNQLIGEIPSGLGELPFLSIFFVDGNQISGCVPESFATLFTLNQFEFFGNEIECLPDLSGTGLSCNRLRGQNNRLTFDDILPNIEDFCTSLFYAPQDSIGQTLLVSVPAGTNYAIDLGIDQTVPDNQYQWWKNNVFYPPILNINQLIFNDIGFADQGVYRAEVTNPGAPSLTLYSREVTIDVFCAPEIVQLDTFICPGEVIQINGDQYGTGFPVEGTYTFPGANRHGCDSVLNVQVFFFEEPLLELEQDICPGDTIIVNGVPYHAGQPSGLEIISGGSSNGCDSLVSINLSVLPVLRDTIVAQICAGDSLHFGQNFYSLSGTYPDTFTAINGCDSISVLVLTVNPVSVDTISAQICQGDTFQFGASSYFESGQYTDSFLTTAGCDSIFVIELEVAPVYANSTSASICESDSFFFEGGWVSQAGLYSDTLQSVNGCDSILELNLTVLQEFHITIDTAICAGDSVQIGDSIVHSSGTFVQLFAASNGCDSILTWNVQVLQSPKMVRDTFVCAGTSLTLEGQLIQESGTYPSVYVASNGCDSLVEWQVEIGDTALTDISAEICQGVFILFAGQELTESGIYRDTLQTISGCDSIVTLDLSVQPVLQTDLVDSLCQGDSLFFGNSWLSAAGIYSDTLQSLSGCDSIAVLTLSVNPTPVVQIAETICQGDSILFGGKWRMNTGEFIDTSTTQSGCDSFTVLSLEVLPVPQENLQESICEGEVISFGGRTLDTSGVYLDTLVAANGCDSIVILQLEVRPVSFTNLQTSICQGDSLDFGTQILSLPGTYVDTLTAVNGCDSIVTLSLEVLPVFQTTLPVTICDGDSVFFGGSFRVEQGFYLDTLQAGNGCDSVVILDLNVLPIATTAIDSSVCEGEIVIFGGQSIQQSGIYTDTLSAENGCDSIVTLQLIVKSLQFVTDQAEICEGEVFRFGDRDLESTGVYQHTFTGSNGCDSTVELTLTVLGPVELGSADAGTSGTVCTSETILNAGQLNAPVTGRWEVLAGTGQPVPPDAPEAVVSGMMAGQNTFSWIVSSPLCPDYDADTITLFVEGTPRAFNDQEFQPYTADSLLIDLTENDQFVQVTDFFVSIVNGPSLGSVILLPNQDAEYRGPKVEGTDVFSYALCNSICPDLCDTAMVTILLEEPPLPSDPDIPNAFTPNADGVNDMWVIGDLDRLSVVYPANSLVVFNRWGDIVYEASPYRNDWDGRDYSSGKALSEGTYWYVFRLSASDRKVYTGDVTILR